MEVSAHEDAPAQPYKPRSVTFDLSAYHGAEKETTHLLSDPAAPAHSQETMNYQQHENHRLYGENGHPPAMIKPQTNDFYSAPVPLLATSKFELQPVPPMHEWPEQPLRIACTHCGHFIETSPIQETGERQVGLEACWQPPDS